MVGFVWLGELDRLSVCPFRRFVRPSVSLSIPPLQLEFVYFCICWFRSLVSLDHLVCLTWHHAQSGFTGWYEPEGSEIVRLRALQAFSFGQFPYAVSVFVWRRCMVVVSP